MSSFCTDLTGLSAEGEDLTHQENCLSGSDEDSSIRYTYIPQSENDGRVWHSSKHKFTQHQIQIVVHYQIVFGRKLHTIQHLIQYAYHFRGIFDSPVIMNGIGEIVLSGI